MAKQELVKEILEKAKHKCAISGGDYYHIKPKPITMDDGRVVNVEWVQPSYWTLDVLINYRTDSLKTTNLSEKELEQILKVI